MRRESALRKPQQSPQIARCCLRLPAAETSSSKLFKCRGTSYQGVDRGAEDDMTCADRGAVLCCAASARATSVLPIPEKRDFFSQ
jgi:hypothetical protein